jgi:ATP-binding cassette, subfamily B, bacterial MsbA
VNYAGYGMITDLRDDLYNAFLRRSAAFFRSTPRARWFRPSSTMSSACSSRCRRCWQNFCSSSLPDFHALRGGIAGQEAGVGAGFVPVIIYSSGKIGRRVRHHDSRGQDKLAEIQNILHETITGNRIVKAFSMERWEMRASRRRRGGCFAPIYVSVAAFAISSPLMDILGAVAIALLLLLGANKSIIMFSRPARFWRSSWPFSNSTNRCGSSRLFNNNFQQALGASSEIFRFMDIEDEVREKAGSEATAAVFAEHPV